VVRNDEINDDVFTNITDDHSRLTENGLIFLVTHENKRVVYYRLGYDTYLAPISGQGAVIKALGTLCCPNNGAGAKQALSDYLDKVNRVAKQEYDNYVRSQDLKVSKEGGKNLKYKPTWTGYLQVDSTAAPATIDKPPPLDLSSIPKPTCPTTASPKSN
jgi:hypothetical protein